MTDEPADQPPPRKPAPTPAPPQGPAPARRRVASDSIVVEVVNTGRVVVQPGGEAAIEVRVRNDGEVVDRFMLTVSGVPAAWSEIVPSDLRLMPGTELPARILLRPPRAGGPPAGPVAFVIDVASEAEPGKTARAPAVIDVLPTPEFKAWIVPETAHASRTASYELMAENVGNTPLELDISGAEVDAAADVAIQPARLALAPAEAAPVRVNATARRSFWLGRAVRRQLRLRMAAPETPPVTVSAVFVQEPRIPGWLPKIVGAGVAAALAVSFALAAANRPPSQPGGAASQSPGTSNAVALGSQQPGASPSSGGASPAASASQSGPPTLTPFSFPAGQGPGPGEPPTGPGEPPPGPGEPPTTSTSEPIDVTPSPPPPPVTPTCPPQMSRNHTAAYVSHKPPFTGPGDKEVFGKVDLYARATLRVATGGSRVDVEVYMKAEQYDDDHSTAEGSDTFTFFADVPQGWYVDPNGLDGLTVDGSIRDDPAQDPERTGGGGSFVREWVWYGDHYGDELGTYTRVDLYFNSLSIVLRPTPGCQP